MIKNLLLIIICIFLLNKANAQRHTVKDFRGRWRFYVNERAADLSFLNDSLAAYSTTDGLILFYQAYTMTFDNNIAMFRHTSDLNSTKKRYYESKLVFLNDSAFYVKNGNHPPPGIKAEKNKIGLYTKINSGSSISSLHAPTRKDLIGDWYNQFKKIRDQHIIFKDDTNAIFKYEDGRIEELTYTVDFSKQPMTIKFNYNGSLREKLAIFHFQNENDLRFEFYDDFKPLDRFTVFGRNVHYIKEPLAKKLIAEGK